MVRGNIHVPSISNLNTLGCLGSSGCLLTLLPARGMVPVGLSSWGRGHATCITTGKLSTSPDHHWPDCPLPRPPLARLPTPQTSTGQIAHSPDQHWPDCPLPRPPLARLPTPQTTTGQIAHSPDQHWPDQHWPDCPLPRPPLARLPTPQTSTGQIAPPCTYVGTTLLFKAHPHK